MEDSIVGLLALTSSVYTRPYDGTNSDGSRVVALLGGSSLVYSQPLCVEANTGRRPRHRAASVQLTGLLLTRTSQGQHQSRTMSLGF